MRFELLSLSIGPEGSWFSLLSFEGAWHQSALLHIERDLGHWKFDLLWLRPLYLRVRDRVFV